MTKELTKEDVQAIGLAAAKATKGPWKREGASIQSVATGYIMETSGSGGYVGSLSSPSWA